MVCGLLNVMWAVEWYVGCCRVCGLLYGMWGVELYVGCCRVCGLFYGIGVLNGMWAVV